MNINWKERISNKVFWITFIPTLLLLVKEVVGLFGVDLNLDGVSDQLVGIVSIVFALLASLGVVTNPTTEGIGDGKSGTAEEVTEDGKVA